MLRPQKKLLKRNKRTERQQSWQRKRMNKLRENKQSVLPLLKRPKKKQMQKKGQLKKQLRERLQLCLRSKKRNKPNKDNRPKWQTQSRIENQSNSKDH